MPAQDLGHDAGHFLADAPSSPTTQSQRTAGLWWRWRRRWRRWPLAARPRKRAIPGEHTTAFASSSCGPTHVEDRRHDDGGRLASSAKLSTASHVAAAGVGAAIVEQASIANAPTHAAARHQRQPADDGRVERAVGERADRQRAEGVRRRVGGEIRTCPCRGQGFARRCGSRIGLMASVATATSSTESAVAP